MGMLCAFRAQLENRYIRGNIEGTKLDEDGNVIRFLLNATIPYHGEEYVLLVSEEACGDIEQDESFIMRKATDEDGNPCFQSLDDEKLIERIYEAYLEQSEER